MMTTNSFALRNFKGIPVKYFMVQTEKLDQTAPVAVKKPSHHLILLDRSGSMYYDLESLKTTIEKLLTLAEFNDDTQRISLLSYSSSGDVKLHFAKVTVGDVMAVSSPYLKELRSIRVTGMTCISQSLIMAESLIDDSEVTCISLHTDGYANDRSPSQESRDIQTAVDKLKKHKGLFVNTIAYNNYCDFNLMASIANQLSGKCVQAKGIKEVYNALRDTQALLNGGVAPELWVPTNGTNYIIFFSHTAGKVIGTSDPVGMTINGLKDTDDKTVFRFTEIGQDRFDGAASPEVGEGSAIPLAYARAMIAEGNINAAKYALVTSRAEELLLKHYRALVPTEIAAMAADVESTLIDPGVSIMVSVDYGIGGGKATVLQVLDVLVQYVGSIRVDISELTKQYKRRGLKRIAGVRKEDGTLEGPKYSLLSGDSKTKAVASFDINRNTATVNMLVIDPASLTDCATGLAVLEVAGIGLSNLVDYRNYTIVGDGSVCTKILPLRIADKRCVKALVDLMVVPADADPAGRYDIDLGSLPVVDFDKSFSIDADELEHLAGLTVVSKILSAIAKETSEAYTPEQVAALKEHYLSPALYFSGPTTNDYTDLAEALNNGKVDTRLSYKVELGSPKITALSKIPSANAFLERRFTMTVDGAEVVKPKWTEFLNSKAVWAVKALGPKIKLTAIDELCFPIFQGFLGLGGSIPSTRNHPLNGQLLAVIDKKLTGDDAVQVLTTTRKAVDQAIEDIYAKMISPLVFFVGSTGLVPDEFGAKALTAEGIEAKFPDIVLSKDEKEGTFYVLPSGTGDVILTVFTKGEYFTVTAPV